MNQSIYLPICLSVCLSVWQSVHLSVSTKTLIDAFTDMSNTHTNTHTHHTQSKLTQLPFKEGNLFWADWSLLSSPISAAKHISYSHLDRFCFLAKSGGISTGSPVHFQQHITIPLARSTRCIKQQQTRADHGREHNYSTASHICLSITSYIFLIPKTSGGCRLFAQAFVHFATPCWISNIRTVGNTV